MARLWKRFPIRWRKAHLCEWDRTIAGERCVSTRFPEWRFLWTDRYCRFVFAWAILRFSLCYSSYSMCVDVYNDMKDWAEILPSPRLVWTSINVIPVPIIVPVSCASTPQPSRAHTMAISQTECRYHGSEQFYDNKYGRNNEPQEPTWYDYVHRNLKSDRFSEVMCLLFMYKYNGNIDKLKGYRYFL